jgi:hypothetical protein
MADQTFITTILIIYTILLGALFTFALNRGMKAARELETPIIKELGEAFAIDIDALKAEIETLTNTKNELQRSFDRAAVDYEWMYGKFQDQCVCSQGKIIIS